MLLRGSLDKATSDRRSLSHTVDAILTRLAFATQLGSRLARVANPTRDSPCGTLLRPPWGHPPVGSFWSCPVFIAHQLSASGFSSLAGSEAVDGPAAMRLSRCRGDNFFLSWRFLCST